MMATIYGYVRVSSEAQAESGLSLTAQTKTVNERLKRIAKTSKLTVGKVYRDPAVSATKRPLRGRPAGRELNAALKDGDHVVIAKLDRAFRSQIDCVQTCHDWMTRGVTIHFVDLGIDTASPPGRMMVGIMSSFAQMESARLSERLRDAFAVMRSEGRSTNGTRRLGWRLVKGKLVPLVAERKLAQRAAAMRKKGKTCREIADQFNREKIRRVNQPAKSKWNHQAIDRLLAARKNNWQFSN